MHLPPFSKIGVSGPKKVKIKFLKYITNCIHSDMQMNLTMIHFRIEFVFKGQRK